jgi:hypothetical protein
MLERVRTIAFNFNCPNIKRSHIESSENSIYAKLFRQENPYGHFSIMLTDIPGGRKYLEKYGINQPLMFDYLDLAPEEALPKDVNQHEKQGVVLLCPLRYFRNFDMISESEWIDSFTLDCLSDSMRFNQLPYNPTRDIQRVHNKFLDTIKQFPEKKVMVIYSHGGHLPLVVGEKFGSHMPIRDMLLSLNTNIPCYSSSEHQLKDRYNCVLLTNCNSLADVLPEDIAKQLEIPIFYIVGKAGHITDYPTYIG